MDKNYKSKQIQYKKFRKFKLTLSIFLRILNHFKQSSKLFYND